MEAMERLARDYRRIERAIHWLDEHYPEQPDLDALAQAVHLSPYHFHRLFVRWAGTSPKRFLGFLTLAHARSVLESEGSVLDAALDAGLSGPGRLHDLFVTFEAVTPGQAKARGAGLALRHGFAPTPFGTALVLLSERGVCGLSFVEDGGEDAALAAARRRWSGAEFVADGAAAARTVAAAFAGDGGRPVLHLSGTNFQVKVWEALMRLPEGRLTTYGGLAARLGVPAAARAVGRALAANPVAVLVPCHRVIRGTGAFAGYAWGETRRRAIVGWEAARGVQPSPSTSRME